MKKSLLITILTICSLSVKSQIKDTVGLNIPFVDGKIVYEGIVSAPDKTKNDLYQNAQQWFVDYFKSSKDVIQNEDKENGLILGKGLLDFKARIGLGMSMVQHDKVTIKIICKDGKFKYTVYDLTLYPPEYNERYAAPFERISGKLLGTEKGAFTKTAAKDILIKNDIEIKRMIASIIIAMNKKVDTF